MKRKITIKQLVLRSVAAAALVFSLFLFISCDEIFQELFGGSIDTPYFNEHKIHSIDSNNDYIPWIELRWEWTDGADQFILERKAPDESNYFIELMWDYVSYYEDRGYHLTDNRLKWGHTYVYRVKGYSDSAGESDWSDELTVNVPAFFPPDNLTATLLSSGDTVRLEWDDVQVSNVSYVIWRSTQLDGYYQNIEDNWFGTMYEDDTINSGESYYYKISTKHPVYNETAKSEPVAVDAPTISAPVMVSASEGESGQVSVRWNPVAYADGYKLYRAESNPDTDGSYTELFSNYLDPQYSSDLTDEGSTILYEDTTVTEGTEYYYKAIAMFSFGLSGFSPSYVSGYAGQLSGGGSWATLGTDGFASVAGGNNPALVSDGTDLYVVFADRNDSDARLKAMTHTGESGDWTSAGGYLSASEIVNGSPCLYASGDSVYAAFGDPGTGSDPLLYVKGWNSTSSSWDNVGTDDNVEIWDDTNAIAEPKWGSLPSLTAVNDTLYTVYRTISFGLTGALSYTDGSSYWQEENGEGYWLDNSVSNNGTGLDADTSGRIVAALERVDEFQFYRYDSGAWSTYPNTFTPAGDVGQTELWGFLLDSGDTPFLAYETWDGSGYQSATGIVMWNGSLWQDLSLSGELSDYSVMMDISIIEHDSGNGIYVAAVYENTGGAYVVGCYEYTSGSWLQVGPEIELGVGVDSVELALDSSGRPVLVYEEGGTANKGLLHAVGYRE